MMTSHATLHANTRRVLITDTNFALTRAFCQRIAEDALMMNSQMNLMIAIKILILIQEHRMHQTAKQRRKKEIWKMVMKTFL